MDKAYCCERGCTASGSGVEEESLELEYALENEEFRTLPPHYDPQ